MYNQHYNQFSNIFERPQIPFAINPHSQPQATTKLLSATIDLPFLDISCTWIIHYCSLFVVVVVKLLHLAKCFRGSFIL